MRALNGLALLSLLTILPGCLGLIIFWSLNCAGETEVTTNLGLYRLNMDFVLQEEASLDVAPPLSVPLTFSGVR